MSDPSKRYLELGIEDSMSVPCRYHLTCRDLSFILRHAYKKFPKNLQSQIFNDVLLAFRLLPDMEGKEAEAAGNLLFQSVEAALPKQKRVQAVTQFKNAKIALKRRSKNRHKDAGSGELPEDILIHVFSFLDLQSLLQVSQVCRLWHSAAGDKFIWKKQYDTIFGYPAVCFKMQSRILSRIKNPSYVKDTSTGSINWKESLKSRITVISSKHRSHRGYCEHCEAFVWLGNLNYVGGSFQLEEKHAIHQVKPVKISLVVDYVLDGTSLLGSSSSDSDDDISNNDYDCLETGSKLWAYPSYL